MSGQLAWWIGGPVMGLCVVAARVLFGGRLGVTGGFSEVVDKVRHRSVRFDWRGWFVVGVFLGGTVYLAAHGGAAFEGYGWLTRELDGALIGVALVVCGIAIGYGAKVAGGCTSGNGLSGTSMLSPGSLAATATFFATAIVVSFVIEALI